MAYSNIDRQQGIKMLAHLQQSVTLLKVPSNLTSRIVSSATNNNPSNHRLDGTSLQFFHNHFIDYIHHINTAIWDIAALLPHSSRSEDSRLLFLLDY